MNQHQPLLTHKPLRVRHCMVVIVPIFDHCSSIAAHRCVLLGVAVLRHTKRDWNPKLVTRVCKALAMVPYRPRNDTTAALVNRERGHGRQGIADFERVRRIVVFVLHQDTDVSSDGLIERRVLSKRSR